MVANGICITTAANYAKLSLRLPLRLEAMQETGRERERSRAVAVF